MRRSELEEAVRRTPFEPFRVILTTGDAHDVRHPELIMIGQHSAIIGLGREPQDTIYHRTVKVDLLHVVGIEDLPKSGTSSNGSGS